MKFEQYCNDGKHFVKEIATELNIQNPDEAARVMTAVLHTIRETITVEESFDLISQLPLIIKGVYVNSWKPGKQKEKIKTLDNFIEFLMLQNPRATPDDFSNDDIAIQKTQAVIRVIRRHVSVGEVKDIVSQLAPPLTVLWLSEKEEHERQEV